MKLLVILVCLFFERYLTHALSYNRFVWLTRYVDACANICTKNNWLQSPIALWLVVMLPILASTAIVLFILQSWVFGLASLLLHILLFYYCLGPDNAFYPPAGQYLKEGRSPVEPYFENVNSQLFAPILLYFLLGPLGLLFYRLNTVASKGNEKINIISNSISAVLEWFPARFTALCYLLAGHFQNGFAIFKEHLFYGPSHNQAMLGKTGLAAIGTEEKHHVLPAAEQLVEQSLVIYLAILSLISITLWV